MEKFYITTSIAYVNAPPHIGHAFELVQADVLARRRRLKGDDVFFLTGTDEHGAKIAKTAEVAGITPKDLTDKNSAKFRELAKVLDISNDDFIRTTDKERHFPAAQKLWQKLVAAGDIYKKKYQGLYCVGCEAFITQKDLIDGKCAIHLKEPETVEEENYFFKLSKYSEKIGELIKSDKLRIVPVGRKNEILSLISEGLEDVSFSRPAKDLPWGIPVPGDEAQTMYVWCDALVNYISVVGYGDGGERFEKYWPADIHCIGKDILRFHAAIWPGMLLSAGLSLPKTIFVHGFITSGGHKMSKSLGNVVDPFEIIGKYGVDSLRYFLLREIPPADDGDFTIERFEMRHNADLANGLGNLFARSLALILGTNIRSAAADENFKKETAAVWKKYEKSLDEFKFNEALEAVWGLIAFCDGYINETKPWKIAKESEADEKLKPIFGNLLFALANIAWLVQPFLPSTSEKMIDSLGVNHKRKDGWDAAPLKIKGIKPFVSTPPGRDKNKFSSRSSLVEIKKGGHLFARLS